MVGADGSVCVKLHHGGQKGVAALGSWLLEHGVKNVVVSRKTTEYPHGGTLISNASAHGVSSSQLTSVSKCFIEGCSRFADFLSQAVVDSRQAISVLLFLLGASAADVVAVSVRRSRPGHMNSR